MSVIDDIAGAVGHIVDRYGEWEVGVTAYPDKARERAGMPKSWHQWDAQSEIAARALLQYLANRGMESKDCGEPLPWHLFIYKKANGVH